MAKLRIRVRCHCGEDASVPLGQVWQCPQCARRWDTGQISHRGYDEVVASLRRIKRGALAGLVVIVVLTGVGFAMVSHAVVLDAPVVLAVFYFWYLPRYRRRLRRVYATLPTWELAPE
ncbi:MAG TPA: hypothetical protein VE152_13390 [Acidimicrobiales bacterium]|nr:hypothetical protein [Acidimicrobiales bacterium]